MKTLLLITSLAFAGIANAQYTKLLDFNNTNGKYPWGDLISDGTFLYGMTSQGGTYGYGVLFKIKLDGTGYVKLYDFGDISSAQGRTPYGSLIYDGTFLYGMTSDGGTTSKGTIFKIKPDGTGYVKLFDFTGTTNGSNPQGALVSDGTFLYGTTFIGGINNMGVIFKIKPDGTGYSDLHDFTSADGNKPYCSLISDGTFLYGMANGGSTWYGYGVLFKIKFDGTGYAEPFGFNNITGSTPHGSLIYDGTFLYGMTGAGGTSTNCGGGCGVIFKIKPNGTSYSKLLDFTGNANGSAPYGSLISDGTFLYGMTASGGTNSNGTLLKIKTDGTGYVDLLDFAGTTNGSSPMGSLISVGGYLYGMTRLGGTNNLGTIFKYKYCSAITNSFTITAPTCGNNNGSATANTSGGTSPYTYSWTTTPIQTTQTATQLSAGTYTVVVTDVNGCTGQSTANIVPSGILTATALLVSQVKCYGGNDGKATASTSGGTAPFMYSWSTSPIQTAITATGLTAGVYTVTITDSCSAISTATINITQPLMLNDSMSIVIPTCGNNNGNAWAHPSGGVLPYTYSWSTGGTGAWVNQLTGSPTQTLIVTITDANNCVLKDTAIVQCVTGISNYDLENQFIIYPNPNSGTFTISTKEKYFVLTIKNILGEKILFQKIQNEKSEISLRNQSNGIYFLNIKTEQGIANKKIIINK